MNQLHHISLHHGDEVVVADITQETLDRIKREIVRSSVVCTTDQTYVVNDLIKQLLIEKCWGNASEFQTKILAPVLEAFNGVDINPVKFPTYVKSLTKASNKIRQHLLGSQNTTHNLYDLIPQEFIDLFASKTHANALFDSIYDITPPGIGRGEIILTLVSDSVKNSRGDLFFNDIGDVDVKGDGGRLGGDGFAADRSPTMVDGMLQDVGINTRHDLLNKVCEQMLAILDGQVHLTHLYDIVVHRAFANHVAKFDDVAGVSRKKSTALKRYATKASKLITNQTRISFSKMVATFFDNVQKLTYHQFIDGILMMRSYHMREHIEELYQALQQLISPGEQQDFMCASKYLPLIAALHLVCYVVVEKREGVVFLNDRNKSAISFRTQRNIYNDLVAAYNMFTHHDFKLCVAIDHRGKTISVKFNE